jgi:hypothetical protein
VADRKPQPTGFGMGCLFIIGNKSNGAFTLDVKSMLNENLGGILGGTQC